MRTPAARSRSASDREQPRPFESAMWIWHGTPCVDLVNKFVQARTSFRLKRVPRSAPIAVTADSSYRLFVNGRRVAQGPARGFQRAWPFDRVDIAPFLHRGENAMALLTHCMGVHSAKYLHTGWAGLILDGAVAGTSVSTGAGWKVRLSPGHLRTHARLSVQTDFQEQFDARLDDGRWTGPGYDDADWEAPLFPHVPYAEPWPDFSERGLPPLHEALQPPRALVNTGAGRAVAGIEDVSVSYFLGATRWTGRPAPLRAAGAYGEFTAHPAPNGRTASYCLDFGREVVGFPVLEVEGSRGGECLDLLLCDIRRPDGDPLVSDPRPDSNAMSLGHRLVLRRGTTRHEVYFYSGFRYLVVTVRGAKTPLRIQASVRAIAYPLDRRAGFRSSDASLDRICAASAQSLECCMQDALCDDPQREQGQWWGLRGASTTALYLLDDPRIIARGLRQIGMQTAPNGLVYPVAPSMLHNWVLPEIACTWVANLDDYAEWTGDLSVFRDSAGSVRSTLAFLEQETRRGGGLLPSDFRGYSYRLGLSQPRLFMTGAARYSMAHNLHYLETLRAAARLWRVSGAAADARRVQARAEDLERQMRRRFRIPGFPYFRDVLSPRFEPIPPPAPHFEFSMMTSLLLTGLAGAHRRTLAAAVWDALQKVGTESGPGSFRPAPSALYYPLHALYREGYRRELLDYIRRLWRIWTEERGLTTIPEHWWFDPKHVARCSGAYCHAWATFPIEFLALIALGVRREAAAWRRMRFAPEFTAVEAASGCVPTPLGHIEVAWRRDGDRVRGRLKAPRGMEVLLAMGGRQARRVGPFVERFEVAAGAPPALRAPAGTEA